MNTYVVYDNSGYQLYVVKSGKQPVLVTRFEQAPFEWPDRQPLLVRAGSIDQAAKIVETKYGPDYWVGYTEV